jgi:lipopolysaccharide/colanic/teichoic acid biosynthesis glycosyltransferase
LGEIFKPIALPNSVNADHTLWCKYLMRKLMITINQEIDSYLITGTGKEPFRNYIDNKKIFLLLKRFFDIVFSTVVIIFLLSWLIPIIAIAIKLNSKGPVFFLQTTCRQGSEKF